MFFLRSCKCGWSFYSRYTTSTICPQCRDELLGVVYMCILCNKPLKKYQKKYCKECAKKKYGNESKVLNCLCCGKPLIDDEKYQKKYCKEHSILKKKIYDKYFLKMYRNRFERPDISITSQINESNQPRLCDFSGECFDCPYEDCIL